MAYKKQETSERKKKYDQSLLPWIVTYIIISGVIYFAIYLFNHIRHSGFHY